MRAHSKAAGLLAAVFLAACSGSGTSPVSTTQENLGANVLQLAVGTANIYGTSRGLNVVATYRQPRGAFHVGDSAVAVSTPTFTGPAALPSTPGTPDGFFSTIESGPAPSEVGTHTMTATQQTATDVTTFGVSGGVFGLGIEPFNANGNGSFDNIIPYKVPLYDPGNACSSSTCSPDPNAFVPWGGPPAFPNQRNLSNAGQLGQELGLDVFMSMNPVAGTYTLSGIVPANTGNVSFSKSANLRNASFRLPVVVAATPTLDGSGGAAVKIALLSGGTTEAFVQITDIGPPSGTSCNGSSTGTPTYYTLLFRRGGSTTQSLPANLGPAGSPTLCTASQNAPLNPSSSPDGDTFTVQGIGFDYPWFEASYPQSNGNPSPAITGSGGQSDISISPALMCVQPLSAPYVCSPAGSSRPASRRR